MLWSTQSRLIWRSKIYIFELHSLHLSAHAVVIQISNIFSVRVIFRHPKNQELSNSFLEPFTSEVWILTALVGLINWLMLYITVRVERHYLGIVRNSTLLTQPESETFLITSAAICQQGRFHCQSGKLN